MRRRSVPPILAVLATLTTAISAVATTPPPAPAAKPLQFTSGGHIVGFTPTDVVVAAASHALRVEFVGAVGVAPTAASPSSADSGALPLTRVTYPGIWEGITLAYDAPPGGILRSTYTLAPGADPSRIRLRYNAPLSVEPDGGLRVSFATGAMRESAPIAWQDLDGRRIAVPVVFWKAAQAEVGFRLGAYETNHPLMIDPTITWTTFLGGGGIDYGTGIATDAGGNLYVLGGSWAAWGIPVRPFTYSCPKCEDVFVAKLDKHGSLLWNTFLGGTGRDFGNGIAVDPGGGVFVTGESPSTWGDPIREFAGGTSDAFVAKLNSNGGLVWHTFLGGDVNEDAGNGILVDAVGRIYVTGESDSSWGNPIRPFAGFFRSNAYVAALDPNGYLDWNTFLGDGYSYGGKGTGIVKDANENIYVSGMSYGSWGDPIHPISGLCNAFVAKLNPGGDLVWNTFLPNSDDWTMGIPFDAFIAVDSDGNVYVTGTSRSTWGEPVRAFASGTDVFAAKIDPEGKPSWHTFLGGSGDDTGMSIGLDAAGNVFIAGSSSAAWGSPFRAFKAGLGNNAAFVAKLAPGGVLAWNTFLGDLFDSRGRGVAIGAQGLVYVTGKSDAIWGDPIRAEGEYAEAFVAAIPANPTIDQGITVMSPNGGERWPRGRRRTITWTTSETGGRVSIQLKRGRTTVRTIARRAPNTGSFAWRIPATIPAGRRYKIRIVSRMTPTAFDSSDGVFTVR